MKRGLRGLMRQIGTDKSPRLNSVQICFTYPYFQLRVFLLKDSRFPFKVVELLIHLRYVGFV